MNKISFSQESLARALLAFGLVMLCVNLSWFQGHDNRNLLLPVVMCLSPAVLLIPATRIWIPRLDLTLGALCVSATLFPLIFHPDTFEWGGILFLFANCLYFAMLMRLLKVALPTAAQFMTLIRWIVYAFAIVVLVQQFCVLARIPVFNGSHLIPKLPWKLNSLATEASHISFTLGILMCLYGLSIRKEHPSVGFIASVRDNAMLWIAFLWCTLTTANTSSLIFIPIALVPYITRRNVAAVVACIVVALFGLMIVPTGASRNIDRMRNFTASLVVDRDEMVKADASIAHRIVPTLDGARAIAISGAECVTGHGVDADCRDFPAMRRAWVHEGTAGAFKLWYNNGILAELCLLVLIFSVVTVKKSPLTWLLTLLAILSSQQYNFQLFWQLLAFSAIFKYTIARKTRFLKEYSMTKSSSISLDS